MNSFQDEYKQFLHIPQVVAPTANVNAEVCTEYLIQCSCGARLRVWANTVNQLYKIVCRNCSRSSWVSAASHSGQPFCARQNIL